MKTDTFTVQFPQTNLQPAFVDVDTTGTALDGITPGLPTLVTHTDDHVVPVIGSGGDAIVTGRVSAPNTVRLAAKGIGTVPIGVVVTVFD